MLKEVKSKFVSYKDCILTVTINKKNYSANINEIDLNNKTFMYKHVNNDIIFYVDDDIDIKQYKLLSVDDEYKTKELVCKTDILASMIANDKFKYDRTEEEYKSICEKFNSDIISMIVNMVNHNKKINLKIVNLIEEYIDVLNVNIIINKMDIYDDDISRTFEEEHFYKQEKVLYNKFIDTTLKNNHFHKLVYDGIDFDIINEQRELKSIITIYKIKKLEEKLNQKLNDPLIVECFEKKRIENLNVFFSKKYDFESVRKIIEINSKYLDGKLMRLEHFNIHLSGVYFIEDFIKKTNITLKELNYVLSNENYELIHISTLNMWNYEENYLEKKNKDIIRIIFDKINNAFISDIIDYLNIINE